MPAHNGHSHLPINTDGTSTTPQEKRYYQHKEQWVEVSCQILNLQYITVYYNYTI